MMLDWMMTDGSGKPKEEAQQPEGVATSFIRTGLGGRETKEDKMFEGHLVNTRDRYLEVTF